MANATTTENGRGAASVQSQAPARNLYQRIADVTAEAVVSVTGKTQYGKAAMSIEDVEIAVAVLMAKNGIVTRWSDVELASYEERVKDGSMLMWRRTMRVLVINAENPEDQFEDVASDIGSNPAAASSFVRKGYYKALFHLADKADDQASTHVATGATQQQQHASSAPRGTRSPLGPCPECAEEGITAASGKPAVYWPPREPGSGKPPQCNGIRDGVYMNHQQRPLSGVGASVSAAVDDEIPFAVRENEAGRAAMLRRTRCR